MQNTFCRSVLGQRSFRLRAYNAISLQAARILHDRSLVIGAWFG